MDFRRLVIASACILLLVAGTGVSAGTGNPGFVLGCQGFSSSGGQLALNRDNTGAQREAFVISAIDGAGNTIYEPDYDVFFVGTTITIEPGASASWTRSPRYNPLVLQIVSPAGNGLDEQVIAEVVGNCAGLPGFGAINFLSAFTKEAVRRLTGEAFVLQPADGETSDPLQLNSIPPRPINPVGLPEGQPGYAIVNTDNLFIRTGDGPRYQVIGILDGGTNLVVLGRNEDRSWWYVQVGGMRGWVSSEFLILRGDLTGIPVVPVTGSFTPASLYVGYPGNLVYALPLGGSSTLCALPGATSFEIVGRTSNSAWYEIAVTCDGVELTGWLPADLGILRNPANVSIPVTFR
jgi:hypothetical protein